MASKPASEAMALIAEWIWAMRATDDETWRESYPPEDAARVSAEIDKIRSQFEAYGPSAFHRDAAAEAERQRVADIGRLARMAESTRYPSMCIRHRRRLAWMPSPAWWFHDDNLSGPAHTCSAMWDKPAPKPPAEDAER